MLWNAPWCVNIFGTSLERFRHDFETLGARFPRGLPERPSWQTAWHPDRQQAVGGPGGGVSDSLETKLRTRKWVWIVRVAGVGFGLRGAQCWPRTTAKLEVAGVGGEGVGGIAGPPIPDFGQGRRRPRVPRERLRRRRVRRRRMVGIGGAVVFMVFGGEIGEIFGGFVEHLVVGMGCGLALESARAVRS
jgi:hypothetical protein